MSMNTFSHFQPRRIHRRRVALSVLSMLLLWAFGPAAHAKPEIRAVFFSIFTNAIGTQLDNLPSRQQHCGVCHYKFNTGANPWNPFGDAIKHTPYSINDVGDTASISNAIMYVVNSATDWDSDGFLSAFEITNRTYANTPTFPGLSSNNVSQVSQVTVSDVTPYLTPIMGGDTTPPSITVLKPNGGEVLTANRWTNITWTASDSSGVNVINIYESTDDGATYRPIALGMTNSGNYAWVPADRPATNTARIKIVAVDTLGNSTNDVSDAPYSVFSPPFTNSHGVATTLRDFDMAGTQPLEGGAELSQPESCADCHGHYDAATEPYQNWQGSMMSLASHDPLFLANLVIANQDAADSGDICLRCHISRGWLAGRSVPTDGSRMLPEDRIGVSCDLCHRMVDPVYKPGISPTNDLSILAALSFPGTNYASAMYVIDSTGRQRGPFSNAVAPHAFVGSAFHRSANFCGTCHDVSNPAFARDESGVYQLNTVDQTSPNMSPHAAGVVERTYSEWLASAYNSSNGVYAPAFAGAKTNGMVSICQDCHLHDVVGYGANTNIIANVPLRNDLPLHDMTGGSTWIPGLLTNLYPTEVTNIAAIQAGIARSTYILQNAATLAVGDSNGMVKVTVTNECGHKLPTGYPEGRRIWLNVQFYDEANNLLAESGAYNSTNGVLTRDAEAKIYEVHPGIDTNISGALGLDPEATLHFVLNNKIYEDNRIPPRGFANAAFDAFGGAPVGHHYDDGQYWDDTLYTLPAGAVRAEVKLYYQSTSKEFVEFLRDENRTDNKGQEMYDIWATNGMCPPTPMAAETWVTAFLLKSAAFTLQGNFRTEFLSRPGASYTIEFKDSLVAGTWQTFATNGTFTATNTLSSFEDDFTANTSGGPSATGQRYYRFKYSTP
jgi:hypothetical protein